MIQFGGSPPHVRGKRVLLFFLAHRERITPARAGKTSCTGVASGALPDHPRACGEKHVESLSGTGALGSPPRMRGKHCNVEIAGKLRQITPCWKSIVAHIVRCVNKDRSPRVRGKPEYQSRLGANLGITPARAGKTRRNCKCFCSPADHPRACGENTSSQGRRADLGGSPPRVRGKLYIIWPSCRPVGITPARAGKTSIEGVRE